MDKNKKLIGKKIKEIRKKEKITQENFSEMIEIEPSSLSNIENGKSFPSMGTVLKIMNKFKINPEEFFDYEYLEDNDALEEKIMEIVQMLTYKNKQIIFKIAKWLK